VEVGKHPSPVYNSNNTVGKRLAGPVPAGTVIKGRYTVQEALGRGANATTYKAIDNTNGHEVSSSSSLHYALWLLHSQHLWLFHAKVVPD
jgi:hypothetical protein